MALRRRVVTVEAENTLLRTEVSLHQDLGHNLVTDWDVNTMAKTEVAHLIGRQYHTIIQLLLSLENIFLMDLTSSKTTNLVHLKLRKSAIQPSHHQSMFYDF